MARNNRVAKNLINIQPGDVFRKEYSKRYYVALNIYKNRIYCVTLGNLESLRCNTYKNAPENYELTTQIIQSRSPIISKETKDFRNESAVEMVIFTRTDLNLVSIPRDTRGQKYYSITPEDLQGIKNKIMEVLNS